MVDTVSLLIAFPQSEPAPCAGSTELASGSCSSFFVSESHSGRRGRPRTSRAPRGGRPADIADKQRVAGEDGVRVRLAAIAIEDQDGDRLRCVSRGLERLQPYGAELDAIAVGQRRERVFRFGRGAQIDGGADAIPQLEMTRDEIGMKVRQQHVRDPQVVLARERQILIDVALRIDDGSNLRALVADEIRRVRKAIQVELVENHG
jgi:hypothetical protein